MPDQATQSPRHVETIIVGAGPAGLQMGYFLDRAKRDYLIFEANDRIAVLWEKYPRNRLLISLNKRFNFFPEDTFNLRHDWNSLLSDDPKLRLPEYSKDLYPAADDFLRYIRDWADKTKLNIRFSSKVAKVGKRDDGVFTVRLETGEQFTANRVLMATGVVDEYVPDDIKGAEHADTYGNHSMNLADYENKRVCIIGGKNSAFEVANYLAGHAAIITMALRSPLKHAWNSHFPGDLRAINDTFIDMFQLKSLHATIGLIVKEIVPREDGALVLDTETEVPHWDPPQALRAKLVVDKVIICTGFRYFDPEIFDGLRPETQTNGRLARLNPWWETSVPGLYFIGTAMQARDRLTASSFIHGFRYNIRTLFNHLEERYHGVKNPGRSWEPAKGSAAPDLLGVAQALAERVTLSDAMYPQRGFLGDVLTYEDGKATLRHELPLDALFTEHDPYKLAEKEHAVLVFLEFGWSEGAARGKNRRYPPGELPIEYILPSDHNRPGCSAYLHPVFEYYRYGKLEKELHLQESLVVRFVEDDYDDFNKNINRNRIYNFLASSFGVPHEKLVEDFVPADKRDQFYVALPPERVEALKKNPDWRRCPETPYAEQVRRKKESGGT